MYSRYESRDGTESRVAAGREDEYYHKTILRYEGDIRRLTDELNLALIKARRFEELEAKYEGLVRQNSAMSQEKETLVIQLNDRKREIDLMRCQLEDSSLRDAQRLAHSEDLRANLEHEIQMLKKTNNESCLLYEEHINKLERLIEDRTREGEELALRLEKFRSESEYEVLRHNDEKNRLRSDIERTEYEKAAELDHLRSKLSSSTDLEIEGLKKAHYSQIATLEEEVSKFRNLSALKDKEVERMIEQNSNMKRAYEAEILSQRRQSDTLREKLLLQERGHQEELDSLRLKYASLHSSDTDNLKMSYSNESKLLIGEMDNLKNLVCEKTLEIQNLYREKSEQRDHYDRELLKYQEELESSKAKARTLEAEKSREIQSLNSQLQFEVEKGRTLNSNSQAAQSFLEKKVKDLSQQLSARQDEVDSLSNNLSQRKKEIEDLAGRHKQELSRITNEHEITLKAKSRQLELLNNSAGHDRQKTNEQLIHIEEERQNLANQLSHTRQQLQDRENSITRLESKLTQTVEALRTCEKDLLRTREEAAGREKECNKQLRELSTNVKKTGTNFESELKRSYELKIKAYEQQIEHLRNLLEESKKRVEKIALSYNQFCESRKGDRRREEAPAEELAEQNFLEVLLRVSRQALLPIL